MLGERGEQIVQSRDFYALFQGEAEWRLVVGPKVLGTIPISNVVAKVWSSSRVEDGSSKR
jgi:ATP-dependent Lhr-like helicase